MDEFLRKGTGRATFNARKLSLPDGIRIQSLASEAELAAGRAGVIRAAASLTGLSRSRLGTAVDQEFPFLPSGCQIVLDKETGNVIERLVPGIKEIIVVGVLGGG